MANTLNAEAAYIRIKLMERDDNDQPLSRTRITKAIIDCPFDLTASEQDKLATMLESMVGHYT